MKPLDMSQYELVEEAPSAAPAGSQPATAAPLEGDFEMLPSYADGISPERPINKSPISTEDRAKLQTGNLPGKLSYLKKRFEDARADKHGNILVKQGGLWHAADPTGLGDGDAWERTKELVKDAADLYDVALVGGASALGAAGGAAAGPAGMAVGAGAGGAAGEAARTSLGRLYGTYEATPEEQVKDVAWEGLLNMGGQTVAMGAKPAATGVLKAFKNIGEKGTNYTKELLSTFWGDMTGEQNARWAFRRAMDNADAVVPKARQVWGELGNKVAPGEGIDVIGKKQVGILTQYAEGADDALAAEWRKNMSDFTARVPQNFQVDVGSVIQEAQSDLVKQGLARPQMGSNGKWLGIRITEDKKILTEAQRNVLNEFVTLTNRYAQKHGGAPLKGKEGAMKLAELRKNMRQTYDDLITDDLQGSTVANLVGGFKARLDTSVGQRFADAGMADSFIKMNQAYASKADAVKMLKRAVNSSNPQSMDELVKRLASKAGSNRGLKEEVQALADLMPGKGEQMMHDLLDWEAAKAMQHIVTKSFQGGSGTSLVRTLATPVQQANPRMLARQIEYGNKLRGFVGGMGSKQLDALLMNERALEEVLRTTAVAADSEDQNIEQLLMEAGVK
jgi:hypothetical protein